MRRLGLRVVALGYLAAILAAPVALVFYRAFEHGLGAFWAAITATEAVHALKLSVIIALIAVAANTVFGILCAIAIVRWRVPGRGLLSALVDLPLALSPVVVGLGLFLLYNSRTGWFGPWLQAHGIQMLFALPTMILATIFVSLPFVVREVVPLLREIGTEQEQAAATLGSSAFSTFRRITLPAIRWGVAYGVVLTTARALGEFGAVSIVSGRLVGQTQTLPLYVQDRYESFDSVGANAAAVLLALLAMATVVAMTLLKPKEHQS
ncbi:MAG: sulfate ABC transporter [Candidatus Rokuibacteriota bacterium]|nr:MAG: sulfate ABC transporter [Candidatus Rokubacteria bacterium]